MPDINLADAARFLKLLDPTATKFEFRTFDDNHDRDDKDLLKTFYGSLTEHAAELQRLNRKGAGIFVVINETDGKGRKAENIIRIRAVFADLDGAPLAPVMKGKVLPHIAVKSSPGKFHVYWRVEGMALQDFTPVQKAIIERFDSDDIIHDLPRVMRLPGFYHHKAEPFLVHILSTVDVPPHPAEYFERHQEPPHISGDKEPATEIDLILAAGALEILPPAKLWGNRNYIGMAIHRATDGHIEGFEAWCRWLERSGRFHRLAAQRQWQRYFKYPPKRIGIGTLIYLANQVDPKWRDALNEFWRET
jgi:RepB DNA-primase from phage plasmid/Primase C terminal 2 (PriCT-2)